eukprot:1265435-Rhodomonas_salina.1
MLFPGWEEAGDPRPRIRARGHEASIPDHVHAAISFPATCQLRTALKARARLQAGEERRLFIPSKLGYGPSVRSYQAVSDTDVASDGTKSALMQCMEVSEACPVLTWQGTVLPDQCRGLVLTQHTESECAVLAFQHGGTRTVHSTD